MWSFIIVQEEASISKCLLWVIEAVWSALVVFSVTKN